MKKLILLMSVLMLNMYGEYKYDVEKGKNGLYHVKMYRDEEKKSLYMEYDIQSKEDIELSQDVVAIGEVRVYHKNGYLKYLYHVENRQRNGVSQSYSETVNGRLTRESIDKNGLSVGKETFYFDTPEKKIKKVVIHNDKGLQTLIEQYYDNGQLKSSMNLYGQRQEGETVRYDRDGKVTYKAMFKNDKCISGDCDKK